MGGGTLPRREKLTAKVGTAGRDLARKRRQNKQTETQDGAVAGDGTDDAHRISLFSAVFFFHLCCACAIPETSQASEDRTPHRTHSARHKRTFFVF